MTQRLIHRLIAPEVQHSASAWDGVILSFCFLGIFYIFCALAIVCDNFFVPSLNVMRKKMGVSESVAGATLMAVGNSAPEISTNILASIQGGIEMTELGLGTIIGSGVFDFSMCLGIACLFATTPVKIRGAPLMRDIFVYLVSVGALIFFFRDSKIDVYESAALLLLYVVYIVLLYAFDKPKAASAHDKSILWSYGEIDNSVDEDTPLMMQQRPPSPSKTFAVFNFLKDAFLFPITFVCKWTIPPSALRQTGHWFTSLVAFLIMVAYIALLSHGLVVMLNHIVVTLGVSHAMIGLTLVAWGSDIPDTINAAAAVKQGAGEMAVSSAVGGQILNVLVGLGGPWLVVNMCGGTVTVSSAGLLQSLLVLTGVVSMFVAVLVFSKLRLNRIGGCILCAVYISFLVYEWFGKGQVLGIV
eukprot:GILJ01001869.1.p1 GENE.GILJ01001869.1~~GILJ01001869.1.p1  ORF type:complete len:414 (-),score=36.00 GILJ01001869.1:87-1328(-)